ncbi:premnaspirodiene oxygenase-like [Olea europaea subsp. europaea]|uniref:Premnaspirodiene oxygenase-like n=1 Tax=Olea europaea subsp. europaea TaxID=158383 RepID=A0A8S0TSU5_OLEEU|nr:premnaspirodiene oxygenase-like [Olea europaea subsp. europaea]
MLQDQGWLIKVYGFNVNSSRVKENGELGIPLNYDNIKAVISDMFSAGIDTSSSITDWAMVSEDAYSNSPSTKS